MVQTSALEFQRKFGEFQHRAQREPVEITRHGRREFVLMSAEQYDWLVAAAKPTHRTADAASVVIDARRASRNGRRTFSTRRTAEVRQLRGASRSEAGSRYPLRLSLVA